MATKICMAVHALEGTDQIGYAERTLKSLMWETVNFGKHELFISDNGSCPEMLEWYEWFRDEFELVFPKENLTIQLNPTNLGTAKAVNLGMKTRTPNKHIIKMDADCIVQQKGWVEQMEECFTRYPKMGILGLKRKDLSQAPDCKDECYRTTLKFLPHEPGQSFVTIEISDEIMGTCTMFSSALMDAIGYMKQPDCYGWDDILYSARSIAAGFTNAFLPHIIIDHIDAGSSPYTGWKHERAGETMDEFVKMLEDYKSGARPLYEEL